jgi:hypothetical protein
MMPSDNCGLEQLALKNENLILVQAGQHPQSFVALLGAGFYSNQARHAFDGMANV